MIDVKKAMAAFAIGAAVIASAMPASARTYLRNADEAAVGPARAAAIRECAAVAAKYPQTTWGVTQGEQFGACMAQHGQMK
ncbi:MAG: hypothetical protein J0H89_13260 [Rhizobiales bacterium]|nr:hypothetical protein [Hyphomicrobiales bacterium]